MSRNAKYILLAAILVLTITIASVAIVQIAAVESAAASTLSEIQNDTHGYIVKAYDGYVGVYYMGGEDYPAIITEISLDCLRQYDRQLVETGFEVGSRDELMQILEDLGS